MPIKKIVLGVFACLLWTGTMRADELPRVMQSKGPSAEDRMISRTIASLVNSNHLANKLNDRVSERAFETFLRALDPGKVYFLQSDIAEWESYRDDLDDFTKKGDLRFAYNVFFRYNERMNDLMPAIHEQIDAEHDFSVDESLVIDRDEIAYPKSKEEAIDRVRKQIKYNFLVAKANEEDIDDTRKKLHRRYKMLQRDSNATDVYELLEYYLTSVTTSLDPHTTYMAPRAKDNFDIILGLNLDGIGAQLSPEDGFTNVASIVPGGAADRDGRLQVGDKIVGVRQDDETEVIDVVEMKLDDVVSLIRGRAGTVVHLTVEKAETKETEVYAITRAKIELKDEEARSEIIERGTKADGTPFKIGYINLPSFYLDMEAASRNVENYRSTTRDMRKLLKEFNEQGVDSVVLDLARNGGGSLIEAISVTGLFIDRGPVVQVKDQQGRVQPYEDEERGTAWDGPLVVVISQMSASASEIFAGAIKDYNRGLVVGDPTTHGKGTVQTLLDVGDTLFRNASKPLGALKLTIQQFYLPDGKSTQMDGVASDVIIPSVTAYMDIGESDLDYALPTDEVAPRDHDDYAMINAAMKAKLQQQSVERVQNSKEFEKLLKRIEIYRQQKDEISITLNETKFMERRKLLDSQEEDEEVIVAAQTSTREVFRDNPQNNEVIDIAIDYVNALQVRDLAKAG